MSDKIHVAGMNPPAPVEFTPAQLETDPILRYFYYAHLPDPLQGISSTFCYLAQFIVETLPRNAERTIALRKLLEAKDAGVRANVGALPKASPGSFYTRLTNERRDLTDRLDKLTHFIVGSTEFLNLPLDQRELLQRQAGAMNGYLDILVSRIDLIDQGGTERVKGPIEFTD